MEKKIVLNSFKRIAVIESTYREKDELPLAYVCNAEKEEQIENGKNWAGRINSDKEPVIHYFDNEDFTFEVITCPENSNQGGKLSFWICKITTKDGYSFCTNINSLLLEYLLKECDFKKGVCQDKVIFVRNKSQLGLITKNGELYQQLLASDYMRENPKAKIDTYVPGDVVETLKDKYVYIGSLYEQFSYEKYCDYDNHKYIFTITIPKNPIEKYFYMSKNYWGDWCTGIGLGMYSGGEDIKYKFFVTGHMNIENIEHYVDEEFNRDYYEIHYTNKEKCRELFNIRYTKTNERQLDIDKFKEYVEYILRYDSYYKNQKYDITFKYE